MGSTILALWSQAAAIDRTLQVAKQDLSALRTKRVKPTSYSRSKMFGRMMRGEVSLFSNLRVPIKKEAGVDLRETLITGISYGFPRTRTARIQKGRSSRRCRMKVPEVMRRWERGRAILSVTDLHFRKTKFDKLVDTSSLSDFNILCGDSKYGSHFRDLIEMMTLVVSSAGNLTDNHADDCDGTNHCFVGRKLWLAWDRMEGKSAGFQDVDRDAVYDQAAFDVHKFLSLPSARWFTVEPGQTLFLPGNLAHKVITLEHYIGLGSFHVALPSYLRCLERWIVQDTHDIIPNNLLGKIHQAVLRKLVEIRHSRPAMREQWGVAEMKRAVESWRRSGNDAGKRKSLDNALFAEFITASLKLNGTSLGR